MILDNVATHVASDAQATSEANSCNLEHPVISQPSLQIIPYPYPRPFNLLECITNFSGQAATRLRNLYAVSEVSAQPTMLDHQWKSFLDWFHDQIDEMGIFYSDENEMFVNAANARLAHRQEMARRRQALHEMNMRESLRQVMEEAKVIKEKEEAEKKRLEEEQADAARIEAATLEAARLEALEKDAQLAAEVAALKAKALASASGSVVSPASDQVATAPAPFDARLERLEKKIMEQESFNKDIKGMMELILSRLPNPNP